MHNNPQITFIDLFAGIGGFHLAFSGGGCKCLFASEIDPNAQKTYHLNFPKTLLLGDITLESTQNQIPQKFVIFLCRVQFASSVWIFKNRVFAMCVKCFCTRLFEPHCHFHAA